MSTDSEQKQETTAPAEVGQFIGPRKVKTVIPEEYKTNGGKNTVTVHYEGGFSEFMPFSSFQLLITPEPTDFTDLARRKHRAILTDLMAVLAEYDVKGGEAEMISNGLSNEIFNAFNKATHLLWTNGDSNNFTPGSNAVLERSLLDADRVIKSFPDKKSDEPAAATA